ncbi:MAG: Bax inhibitor-1/YccA family protein [Gemmatimonadales bacterium]
MRTANPTLNDKVFQSATARAGEEVMTVEGTVNKSGLLILITMISAAWSWYEFFHGRGAEAMVGYMAGGAIVGFIVALIIIFNKTAAGMLAPVYAVAEGVMLGAFSAFVETRYPGIPMQAIGITFGIFFALLIAYKSGLIPVTANFRLGVAAATGGIVVLYLFSWILQMFGINMVFLHSAGPLGILISLAIVVIASLNLVLDFDFIERGAEAGAPKYMEWYAGFALLVTLVWLYIEVVRLLIKLQSRNR